MQAIHITLGFFGEKCARDMNKQFTKEKPHKANKPILLYSISLEIREIQI